MQCFHIFDLISKIMRTFKTYIIFGLMLTIFFALSIFTSARGGDVDYYFAFDHDHGYYTSIITCEDSHHIRITARGSFTSYGPYHDFYSADHKRKVLIHDYNEEHHNHAVKISGIHCE